MSLEEKGDEILKAIEKLSNEVGELRGDIDQINDARIEDQEEVLKKIHLLDSFCKNTLEKNQIGLWNGLKQLGNIKIDYGESEQEQEEKEAD